MVLGIVQLRDCLRKRSFVQGQRVRLRFLGVGKMYTITEIKVTVDEALDVMALFTLERENEMTLKLTPDELFVML